MSQNLCIYHGNCADGFSAAWVVKQAVKDCEFHAGVYQEPPPDVTGKTVYIVDFSYTKAVLLEIVAKAEKVILLDHHKSAMEDLLSITPEEMNNKLHVVFDMKRAGAMIAWDHFFPNEEPPQIIKHVQDRDLWEFKLEGTREIQAAVFSYEYTFENWDKLMDLNEAGIEALRTSGEALERKHFKDIRELMKKCFIFMEIGGFTVKAYNLPYIFSSDVGHLTCEDGEMFGVCYWDTRESRVFSLRSIAGDDVDVSEIATQYGGGGHRNAAGFKVPLEHELAYGVK